MKQFFDLHHRRVCGALLAIAFMIFGILSLPLASAANIVQKPGNEAIKKLGENITSGATAAQVVTPAPVVTGGTIYYVAPNGNDASNGTSTATPWKTVQKVNSRTYGPGDMILFQADGAWELTTALHPLGSGSASAPIVIGAYGVGAKPRLSAKNIALPYTSADGVTHYAADAIYLENQQYFTIRDLDISSLPDGYTGDAAEAARLTDRRGIHIVGGNNTVQTVLQGFRLHDLYIHDIAGEWQSIAGAGWDPSKRTAGILFEIIVKGANGLPVITNPVDVTGYQPTWFANVTIENNVLVNNSFGSIIIKQLAAWGARQDASSPYYDVTGWYPHTGITIQNNYLDHTGSDWAADTIYVTATKNSVVRHNVSNGAGTAAIELYFTDGITIEWNEVYGAKKKPTGTDSAGIDTDKATTNALVQFNYLHDNGDGILLCGFTYGSSVYRYNVIKDSDPKKLYLNIHGSKGNNYIYNNVFYNSSSGAATFVGSSGGSAYLNDANNFEFFYNNIFYSPNAASAVGEGTSVTYDNNSYLGVTTVPAGDTHAIVGDPQFQALLAVAGGAGTSVNLDGLKLRPASPLIGAGRPVTAHPATTIPVAPMSDLEGKAVLGAGTDLGAFVVQPDLINLTVTDSANAADWAIRHNLQTGATLFGDRTLTITSLPALYAGSDWLRTANDSKGYSGTTLASFTVTRNATVYVASDDRITVKPAWLASWTATTDMLTEMEGTVPRSFAMYKKNVAANTVVSLGGNGSSTYNNYAVIVKPMIANLVVGDTLNAASWSVQRNVQPGDSLYGDRTVTIATLPSVYSGADWIRSANSSKAYTGTALVRFTVTRNATLAVALDDRIAPAPAWLASWTATTDTLTDDENGESRSFKIYTKPAVANTQVTLGDAGTTTYNNYMVMVK